MASIEKITQRITHSKWTKAYVLLACIQGLTIIALQAVIAFQNTAQVRLLTGINTAMTTDEAEAVDSVVDRLTRIKWENIAFIGFQLWFVCMSFDATVYQNAAEVISLAVVNVLCAVLGALEVIDGRRWLHALRTINNGSLHHTLSTVPIQVAFYIEIALSACLALFAIAFAYLSYMVVRDFGWVIYKKLGADVTIQKMYRNFQFFVLALKIDIFIEFLVSCFYLIQFALKTGNSSWETWFFLAVTLLMLPLLYFGRMTVCAESHQRMIVFILFQLVVVVQFVMVLRQTLDPNDFWYTWICFVVFGMVAAIATSVLGGLCMHNFHKGLMPYVQRGAEKRKQTEQLGVGKHISGSWAIDED